MNSDIHDVNMSNVNSGIEVELSNNTIIDIKNNEIDAHHSGILINQSNQADIDIANNLVEVGITNQNANMTIAGIDLQSVIGSSGNLPILQNNIIHVFGDTGIDTHYGVRSSNSQFIKLLQNDIIIENEAVSQTNARAGLGLFTCSDFTVACNDITGVSNNIWSNGSSSGMYILNTTNSDYSCNTLDRTARAMQFNMGCSDTQILTNTFNGLNGTGIEMGDGNTTAMFGAQIRNGNVWAENIPTAARYNNFNQSSLNFNRFEIQEGQTCNNSVPDFFPCAIQVTSGNPLQWFRLEPGAFAECDEGASPCDYPTALTSENENTASIEKDGQGTPEGGNEELDEAIMNGTIFTEKYNEELTWQLKRALYKKLEEKETGLLDFAAASFFTDQGKEAIGQLESLSKNLNTMYQLEENALTSIKEIRSKIQSLNKELSTIVQELSSSSGQNTTDLEEKQKVIMEQLQSALASHQAEMEAVKEKQLSSLPSSLAVNETIVPTNSYEANEQIVNNIWASTIALGDKNFSSDQIKQLTEIAELCPIEGGYIPVYKSRSMLLLIDIVIMDEGCFKQESDMNQQENTTQKIKPQYSKNKVELESFKVLPNPANDHVEISWYLTTAQPHRLMIHDLTGKTIRSFNIEDQMGRLEIDTDQLNTGLYWISMVDDESGRIVYSDKIVIQH